MHKTIYSVIQSQFKIKIFKAFSSECLRRSVTNDAFQVIVIWKVLGDLRARLIDREIFFYWKSVKSRKSTRLQWGKWNLNETFLSFLWVRFIKRVMAIILRTFYNWRKLQKSFKENFKRPQRKFLLKNRQQKFQKCQTKFTTKPTKDFAHFLIPQLCVYRFWVYSMLFHW